MSRSRRFIPCGPVVSVQRIGVERPALAREDERTGFMPARSNGLLCGPDLNDLAL